MVERIFVFTTSQKRKAPGIAKKVRLSEKRWWRWLKGNATGSLDPFDCAQGRLSLGMTLILVPTYLLSVMLGDEPARSRFSGEHRPLACRWRRLAANLCAGRAWSNLSIAHVRKTYRNSSIHSAEGAVQSTHRFLFARAFGEPPNATGQRPVLPSRRRDAFKTYPSRFATSVGLARRSAFVLFGHNQSLVG